MKHLFFYRLEIQRSSYPDVHAGGASRWNISRAQESVQLEETSRTRMFDVRLMFNINHMSNEVLGRDLLPEFKPPGKPTGKVNRTEMRLKVTLV